MATYRIVTSCIATTEYLVEADSLEEAEQRFTEGQFDTGNITDYSNEDLERVELVDETPDEGAGDFSGASEDPVWGGR